MEHPTLGTIIQDVTTEAACKFLGLAGFDGIDDTDIEILTIFTCEVFRRAAEKIASYHAQGIVIELNYDIRGEGADDPREGGQDWRREFEEAKGRHPGRGTVREVPNRHTGQASGASTDVVSLDDYRVTRSER